MVEDWLQQESDAYSPGISVFKGSRLDLSDEKKTKRQVDYCIYKIMHMYCTLNNVYFSEFSVIDF